MMKQRKWTLLLLLTALSMTAVVWWGLPWAFELPKALGAASPISVQYLASDGTPLRTLLNQDGDRVGPEIDFKEMPDMLVKATLAAEDRRFWQHGGIDLLAVIRALRDNWASGRVVSGASTLHQQLIKVTSRQMSNRSLRIKVIEAFQARRLAMSWSREKVVATYLNRIHYGNLLTGCTAAASGYFNKPLMDLSLAECAFLAAIPQAPSRLNPFQNQALVSSRQQRVLHAMRKLGWITADELKSALAETIVLQRFTGGFAAPHAIEMIKGQGGGSSTKVRTTLDASLQKQVERIVSTRLALLKDRNVTQAAVVVLENATGNVLALAGSRDFFSRDGGQVNGAWVPHSPGSALKPFTYELAFERGYTAAHVLTDLPVEFPTATGTYRPENYARRLYGPVTCRDALGNSLNIATVRLLDEIGGAAVLLPRLQDLGLDTLNESAEHYGLGLTLGNPPIRLIELANAYATIARLGGFRPWKLLPDMEAASQVRRVMQAESCYLIADILSDNQARSLTFGLHSPLRMPFRAAVKTGTSQSYRDNWALGFTAEYTVGVWTGNFDNSPMQEVSGVTGAAPIWREVLLHLHQHRPATWLNEPPTIIPARVDPRTGHRLTAQSPPSRLSREELFVRNNLPRSAKAQDYDSLGRAILPASFGSWVRSADNWLGDLVTCLSEGGGEKVWRIRHPSPGTVIQLDPDLPGGGRRLQLEVDASEGLIEWSCRTLQIHHEAGRAYVLLKAGRHEFMACHRATGELQHTYIIVHDDR